MELLLLLLVVLVAGGEPLDLEALGRLEKAGDLLLDGHLPIICLDLIRISLHSHLP
jgi:hypothetical protein